MLNLSRFRVVGISVRGFQGSQVGCLWVGDRNEGLVRLAALGIQGFKSQDPASTATEPVKKQLIVREGSISYF